MHLRSHQISRGDDNGLLGALQHSKIFRNHMADGAGWEPRVIYAKISKQLRQLNEFRSWNKSGDTSQSKFFAKLTIETSKALILILVMEWE